MGTRSKRFAMIVEDGVVKSIAVEEAGGQTAVSSAAHILEQL
jgi:peroxiredoxin